MTARINRRIAACLASTGKITESEFTALGWTQDEIDAAVKAGAIKRVGNRMGATTLRYLYL